MTNIDSIKTMTLELKLNPGESNIAEIKNRLVEFNKPVLKQSEFIPFTYEKRDRSNQLIGGLYAEIWGNWLIVNYLWVSLEAREQGLGKQLIHNAEDFARSKLCTHAVLTTFSFQAKPFYEKLGYECQLTLDNYPSTSQWHHMIKVL